jgi:crotonobetainyl-CoA:carnitine CoA-transferase CaiB-like acyl-CoA transferase
LDFKKDKGREILRRLIAISDVLVENYRMGTLDKAGFGYDAVKEFNPRIIYCSITGYGPTGPMAEQVGVDVVVAAEAGLIGITGENDRPPSKVGVAITDILTALFAQGAIANALYHREKTGVGQKLDLSLFESQVATLFNLSQSYLVSGDIPQRCGLAHASIVPYQGFHTKDDAYIMVAVTSEKMWEKFCQIMGIPEFKSDPRFNENKKRVINRDQLVPLLEEKIAARDSDDWISAFRAVGIPCGRINTMDRVFSHPQIQPRNMVVELDHPTAQKIKLVGVPVKYSETPGSVRLPPPLLGQHTDEILSELLGYSREEIYTFREKEIV